MVNTWTGAVVTDRLAHLLTDGRIQDLSADEIERLASQGFLVADPAADVRAYEFQFFSRKYRPPALTLHVAPSDRGLARLDAARRADVGRMLDHALAAGRHRAARLRLVAAEPLEAITECSDLIERARAVCARRRVSLSTALATSGPLVWSPAASSLAKAVDVFELTLCDSPAAHRAHVATRDRDDSYAATLDAIAKLAALDKELVVRLWPATRPRAESRLQEVLTDLHRALGGVEPPGLRFVFGPPRSEARCPRIGSDGWPAPAPAEPAEPAIEPAELQRLLGDTPFRYEQFEIPQDRPLPPPQARCADLDTCSYLRGCALEVAASGEIVLCPSLPVVLGHVSRSSQIDHRYLRIINANPFDDDECRECALVPLCAGRCPVDAGGTIRWRHQGCRARAREVLTAWATRRRASTPSAPEVSR